MITALLPAKSTKGPETSMGRPYQICTSCIMDTSDSNITFDANGRCDYCNNYYDNILPNWHPDERGRREIMEVADKIRREGKEREHDCIIDISGGPGPIRYFHNF